MILIRKHGLAIATFISVVLVILAANIQPQPARFWLLISGWPVLGICIWGWFGRLPEKSPFRDGLMFSVFLAVLFFSGVFGWGGKALFNLLFEPSWRHLFSFLTNRAFLFLTLVYLASVCVFYHGQLQELQEDLNACRGLLNRTIDDMDRERNAGERNGEPDG